MRQPDKSRSPFSVGEAMFGFGGATGFPGAEAATRAIVDLQNGRYVSGVRRAIQAGMDVSMHGVIPNNTDWSSHPKGLEAWVPAWAPMREGIADADEGNYGGAVFNAGLVAADGLTVGGALEAGAAERALNARLAQAARNNRGAPAKDPRNWGRVRRAMGHPDVQLLKPRQPGHHWLIPRNGWGEVVPNALKNRPWNIVPMADKASHQALHGNFGAKLASPLERYLKGTPMWWKALNAEAALRYGDATSTDPNDIPDE